MRRLIGRVGMRGAEGSRAGGGSRDLTVHTALTERRAFLQVPNNTPPDSRGTARDAVLHGGCQGGNMVCLATADTPRARAPWCPSRPVWSRLHPVTVCSLALAELSARHPS